MTRMLRKCFSLVNLHREFSSNSHILQNKSLSPENILARGLKKMEKKGYRKSESDAEALLEAGKELGISEQEVRKIYDQIDPNLSTPYSKLSPAERAKVDQLDLKAFSTPSVENAHDPFEYDDIPSLGHLQLQDHRNQRHYNRVAAYDLPQLSQFCTPYKAPTSKDVLQFTYRVYLGEKHPASGVVTLKFDPRRLGLTPTELHKFLLIAGVRYDYTKHLVTMSSSKFSEQAQNKRYLGDLLNKMLQAARDPSDSFLDIPLENRHIRARERRKKSMYPNYAFPDAWKRPQDAPKPKEDAISRLRQLALQP